MKLINSFSEYDLYSLVEKQLNNFFVFDKRSEKKLLYKGIRVALQRSEKSMMYSKNKYFSQDGEVIFNPFHSGQYAIFLYYLSNTVKEENSTLADRVYFLNKALNAVDLFYDVELPEIFFLDHPVGTVMGRGNYANYFSFSQNCTVGHNKGVYPTFNEYVTMLSGAKVIGDTVIGKKCIISANAYIKDAEIPDYSIVFGSSPHLVIKKRTEEEMDKHFMELWKLN